MFYSRHGIRLANHPGVGKDDDPTGSVARWIANVCDFVEDYIRTYNPSFDSSSLSSSKLQILLDAMMIQGVYILKSGYSEMFSGYDKTTNTLVDKVELDKRAFCEIIYRKLVTNGFLYRGIG